jgi:prepilin-type N-terminal cleavage/methylation domain-containing protein
MSLPFRRSTAPNLSGHESTKAKLKMNLFAQRNSAAFTLIEMIVVILVIAILAAFIMTGASSVLDHAKRAQAKNDVTQIITAVNAFYTEYGKYPVTVTSSTTDAFFGTGTAPGGMYQLRQ